MNMINPRKAMDAQPVRPDPELEGKFREIIRRDAAPMRMEGDNEIGAPGINALLQQIAGSTFNESTARRSSRAAPSVAKRGRARAARNRRVRATEPSGNEIHQGHRRRHEPITQQRRDVLKR
jgi:hypothetical protein